jgi:hypothetical protein
VTRTLTGQTFLWTALDAAVMPAGDTTARDGAAWFAINVNSGSIAQQGYITARGANLIYPAVGAPSLGTPVAVFTITSKTINPSAAYSILGSNRIITVANGASAHLSFADVLAGQGQQAVATAAPRKACVSAPAGRRGNRVFPDAPPDSHLARLGMSKVLIHPLAGSPNTRKPGITAPRGIAMR